jgi:hypothetical protein
MPFHHDQHQESQRKWREKKEIEGEMKKSRNDKEKKGNFIAALPFISNFQWLHIINNNYLISDTSWDGLAAEWRSKLYGIEEIELRTTTLSSQLLFITPSYFLMPVFSLFFNGQNGIYIGLEA